MKKSFLFLIVAMMAIISTKAQVVYTVENGITYRVTGTEGVQINPDGSFNIIGERILIPVNLQDLLEQGGLQDPNNYPPVKYACNTSRITLVPVGGQTVNFAIFNNTCGHRNAVRSGGITYYSCANVNQYLCSTHIGSPKGSLLNFSDCD